MTMADDWAELGCDLKVVFINDKPEEIVEDAHKLLQDSLSDGSFVVAENQCALVFVAQPRVFNPTDENGTDVRELEPRIEFYIGVIDKFKPIGCVFVFEHLMRCFRENQRLNRRLLYLRYRVELRPPFGIDLLPFKRHLSASDTARVGRVLFGNVLWHNRLYVRRIVRSYRTKIEEILGKDIRQVHITSPTTQNRKNSCTNGGRAIVGQQFAVEKTPLEKTNGFDTAGTSVDDNENFPPEDEANLNGPETLRPTYKGSSPMNSSNGSEMNGCSLSVKMPLQMEQQRPLCEHMHNRDSGVVLVNGNELDFDEIGGIVPICITPPPEDEEENDSKRGNAKKSRTKKVRKTKKLQLPDGRTVDYEIKADFEHDRQMLSLTFFSPFEDMRSWPTIDKYKMEIRYSSISHVMMAFKRKGRNRFGLHLFLRLFYPPAIWCTEDVFGLKERLAKDKRPSRGKRVLGWSDPYAGPGSKEAVADDIKDSPVIKVELNSMQADELSELISRFMVELKQKVEMRNISEIRQMNRPKIHLNPEFYNHPNLLYWIETLSTRGYVVMDHWIEKEEREDFFDNLILNSFNEDREQTLEALEMLADKLLDRAEIKHHYGLGGMLSEMMTAVSRNGNYAQPLRDGFERVKKVIITPSRIIPCGHEILMGNRALRFDRVEFPPEKFLRIIFRDENWERIHKNQVNGWLLERFVLDRLIRGIRIAEQVYSFLGTSNSQMRDGGCYFLQTDLDGADEFRNRLGQFSMVPTIPKMMSRLGLCFTQGQVTVVDMKRRMLAWDFTGGCFQNEKEPYTFSDGCGCLSVTAACKISDEIGLDMHNMPSCFQFRFAGYKGVLAVNPMLDQNKKFYDDFVVDFAQNESQSDLLAVDFLFRPSQKKFDVWQNCEEECRLDIVKCSAPTTVVLNKPLINILDQVSQAQSDCCHKRICSRIHSLLDRHIFAVCASLTDEVFARRRLQELPRLIDYGAMNSVQFTREPFFRLVLRAAAKVTIHRVCQKLAIAIPPSLGRMMFGVVDETGILQYGQVFVQYTLGIDGSLTELGWRHRKPQKGPSRKRILTGQVLITKNPSVVGGDVRMFEAVDVVALHHLVDVLVFPRYGPRPHSDEMAGSDLDGDEYTIIWDEQLFLDGTQPAADYSAPKVTPTLTVGMSPDEYQQQMASFFVNYLSHDSVGQISNSHLANSDLYGIDSDVCATIAKKHSQAVDFPKTGVPPTKLTVQWNEATDVPPEKYERTPDFMGKMSNEPHYISDRLNAQLYRRIKALSDFLLNSISDESVSLPDMDELLLSLEEHEQFLELAADHYQKYAYSIRSLMDSYGIGCEGELFSSSYSSLCNRISDRENDDMSFFTTSRVVEQRLWNICLAARKTFFCAFGGDMDTLTDEEGFCREPPDQLKLLARAYYTIGYNSTTRKFLSFPWVASWDVLDAERRSRMLSSLGQHGTTGGSHLFNAMFDSFGDRISGHIDRFVSTRQTQLEEFSARCFGTSQSATCPEEGDQSETLAIQQLLARYVHSHEGLATLMFFCVAWADHMGLFEQSPLKEEHICLLLLSTGLTNQPQCVLNSEERRQWLNETPVGWTESEAAPRSSVTRPGRRFSSFIESLASRHFEQLHCLDFAHLGLGSVAFMFMGEWRVLQQIALKTYYSLVFKDHDLDVLPPVGEIEARDEDDQNAQHIHTSIKQGDVFVVELPCRVESDVMLHNSKLRVQLCALSGCHEVILRRHPRSLLLPTARPVLAKAHHSSAVGRMQLKPIRVLVSSWGSREALERLRQFFAVRPQLDLSSNRRSRIQILPEETFEKLDKLVNGGTREREERLDEEASDANIQGEGIALELAEEFQFSQDEGDESEAMSDE